MVTFTKRYESFTVGKVYCDGDCLSTDTKPTKGIANGSKLYEMDTGKKYMFDEEHSTWIQVSTGEGGGSVSGGGGFMLVNVTASYDENDDLVYAADKTFAEMAQAYSRGVQPVVNYQGGLLYLAGIDHYNVIFSGTMVNANETAVVTDEFTIYDDGEVWRQTYSFREKSDDGLL